MPKPSNDGKPRAGQAGHTGRIETASPSEENAANASYDGGSSGGRAVHGLSASDVNGIGSLPAKLRIVPLEAEHGRQLCEWRYEPPYDVFNWPDWETMSSSGAEFGDPQLRARQYAAVVGEGSELAGFVQFFPISGVTRLGVGLRPDLCGRGLGLSFVTLAAQEARRRAPADEIDLEVLTWNARAIAVYFKAGFRITDTYTRHTPTGPALFHCMVWNG